MKAYSRVARSDRFGSMDLESMDYASVHRERFGGGVFSTHSTAALRCTLFCLPDLRSELRMRPRSPVRGCVRDRTRDGSDDVKKR